MLSMAVRRVLQSAKPVLQATARPDEGIRWWRVQDKPIPVPILHGIALGEEEPIAGRAVLREARSAAKAGRIGNSPSMIATSARHRKADRNRMVSIMDALLREQG
jgi:hypothetical protein